MIPIYSSWQPCPWNNLLISMKNWMIYGHLMIRSEPSRFTDYITVFFSLQQFFDSKINITIHDYHTQIYVLALYNLIQPTISLEMPVPSQSHYGFHNFPFLTDFVCLYTYEFWLSLCKIPLSSVILLYTLIDIHVHVCEDMHVCRIYTYR